MNTNESKPYDPHGVETVQVVGQDGGSLTINKSDYDANPDNWTLYGAKDRVPGTEQEPGGTSHEVEYDVRKDGKKWVVYDKVSGDVKLNEAGYASETEAWNAAIAAQPST